MAYKSLFLCELLSEIKKGKETFMEILYENFLALFQGEGWKYIVMWAIGGLLIFLAIKKDMEPTLILPLGFGTIMVNLPISGAIGHEGPLTTYLMRVSRTSCSH